MTTQPEKPNEAGDTPCVVRWMVETPDGWLGAWDKGAFDAYASAAITKERERFAEKLQVTRAEASLAIGELTAQEWRTCCALLKWMRTRLSD